MCLFYQNVDIKRRNGIPWPFNFPLLYLLLVSQWWRSSATRHQLLPRWRRPRWPFHFQKILSNIRSIKRFHVSLFHAGSLLRPISSQIPKELRQRDAFLSSSVDFRLVEAVKRLQAGQMSHCNRNLKVRCHNAASAGRYSPAAASPVLYRTHIGFFLLHLITPLTCDAWLYSRTIPSPSLCRALVLPGTQIPSMSLLFMETCLCSDSA